VERSLVRKLLVQIPKSMHWNISGSARAGSGRWLDICDEAGLLFRTSSLSGPAGRAVPRLLRTYDSDEMIRQYKDWMRDNWNTRAWLFGTPTTNPRTTVWRQDHPAVRPLDLSNGPGKTATTPGRPDDSGRRPSYLMSSGYFGS